MREGKPPFEKKKSKLDYWLSLKVQSCKLKKTLLHDHLSVSKES